MKKHRSTPLFHRTLASFLAVSLVWGSVAEAAAQVRSGAVRPGLPAAPVLPALETSGLDLRLDLDLSPNLDLNLNLSNEGTVPAFSPALAAAEAPLRSLGSVPFERLKKGLAEPKTRGRELDRAFDGSFAKRGAHDAVAVPALAANGFSIRKTLAAAALGLSLLAPPAFSQDVPRAASQYVAPATSVEARATNPAAPVSIRAETDKESYALADPIRVTLTFENRSDKPKAVPMSSIREALSRGLGRDFEVLDDHSGEMLLAPGAKVEVDFEVVIVGLPGGFDSGGALPVGSESYLVLNQGESYQIPPVSFELRSVLPEQAQGQPAAGPKESSPWATPFHFYPEIAAAWAAAIAGMWLAWRYLFRRRRGNVDLGATPELAPPPLKIPQPGSYVLERLVALQAGAATMPRREFYRRMTLLVDAYLGMELNIKERLIGTDEEATQTLRELTQALRGHAGIDGHKLRTLEAIGKKAELALYAGREFSPADRVQHLEQAIKFVERMSGLTRPAAPEAGSSAAAWLPVAAAAGIPGFLDLDPISLFGVTFGRPEFLFLALPVLFYAVYRLRKPKKRQAYEVPSKEWLHQRKSLRQRLLWLPKTLAVGGLLTALVAAADPMWGYDSKERVVSSLDTVVVVDRSGSMAEGMDYGSGQSKIDAARDATSAFIEQQAGTTNRVGLIVFTEEARLVMNLTLDYDALNSAFEVIQADGGTRVGKALDAAITHYLEMNIIDLDARFYPEIEAVRDKLKNEGLAAALEEAQKSPRLLKLIQDVGREKSVLFVSDGIDGSRQEILDAVERAKALGVRIFAVGIPQADGAVMQLMAEQTGGSFFWAYDEKGMQDAFIQIDKLQKALVKAHGVPQPIHHDHKFAAASLLMLLLSMGLGSTVLRNPFTPPHRRRGGTTMAALALALTLPLMQVQDPTAPGAAAPAVEQGAPRFDRDAIKDLLPYREIPEIRQATTLYNNGKYDEAIEAYQTAIDNHPDLPELSLYKGMAHRMLGQREQAEAAFQQAERDGREQDRPDVRAAVELERGNLARDLGDAAAAGRHYRNALRTGAHESHAARRNVDQVHENARWNYESLLRQGKNPPSDGDGQPDPQGNPQRSQDGKGKPDAEQQGENNQDQQGENNQDQQGQPGEQDPGEQKPGEPQEGKPQEGEPQEGEGPKPQTPDQQAIEALKKQQEKKDQSGGGAGRGIGRHWALLPFGLAGSMLGDVGDASAASALEGVVRGAQEIVWTQPEFLLLAAVALPLMVLFTWRLAKKRHRIARDLDPANVPKKLLKYNPVRRLWRKTAVLMAGVMLLATAASGPHQGSVDQSFSFGGKDIVVLQDVSLSVRWAEDGRFDASTDGLERFSEWLKNGSAVDRVAVVPFAGQTGEAVLSNDHRNVKFQLYHLTQDGMYLNEGSDIPSAVENAMYVFRAARDLGPRDRVLIVISDGGESSEYIDAAARVAKDNGVTVYTLGIGSKQGTRMKVPERYQGEAGGEFVGGGAVTYLNDQALRELAEKTGGAYFEAQGGAGIEDLLAQIATREKAQEAASVEIDESVANWFVIPGALLVALGLMLGDGSRPTKREMRLSEPRAARRAKKGKNGAALAGFALPLGLGGPLSGADPILWAVAGVTALLLWALWLSIPARAPKSARQVRQETDDRLATVRRAANRIRIENLLRGEFQALDERRAGVDHENSVPHTNEPRKYVDHRTSARTGRLYAKRFEEEPEIPMYIAVDLSRSSAFGSGEVSKRDVLEDVGTALALAAAKEEMPVGLILFTDTVETVFPAKSGSKWARELTRLIRDYEPKSKGTDVASSLREVLNRMPRRGVVAVLSDFNSPDFAAPLAGVAGRHVVVPVVVEDSMESAKPVDLDLIEMEDAESGERALVDTSSGGVRKRISGAIAERREATREAMSRAGLRPLYLTTERGYMNRLVEYFQNGGRS